MFDEQKIRHLLDHRMQSADVLRWAFDLRSNWSEAPSIAVHIDGKLAVEGNLDAITNPMLEVGLVHCRALLEFLGLCDSKGSLGQIKDRRKTDVGVEHFRNAAGPLKKVEPEVALNRYEGDRAEAEKALVAVLHVTNKGLAHNTMDLIESPEGAKLIEIASRGVPALMVSYFYTPLGLPKPDSWIKTRPRGRRVDSCLMQFQAQARYLESGVSHHIMNTVIIADASATRIHSLALDSLGPLAIQMRSRL